MQRAATSVFLAGWIGFLVVSALGATLAILQVATIPIPDVPWIAAIASRNADLLRSGGNAEILATTFAALTQFTAAAFLGLALWLVHRPEPSERTEGETLAIGTLGGIGLLVLAMNFLDFGLFERFGSLIGIEIVVVLSILAVAFDRLIAVDDEDDPADDQHFRAAVTLIGQRMAHEVATRNAAATDPRAGEERR